MSAVKRLRAHRDAIRVELVRRGRALPCPSDLIEAAALIEDRDAIEDGREAAACALGFEGFGAAVAAIGSGWRSRLREAVPATPEAAQAVEDGLRLIEDAGGELVALGWDARDLFGVDPEGRAHGLAFHLRGGSVETVERDVIRFRAGGAGRLASFWRGSAAEDGAALWEGSGDG